MIRRPPRSTQSRSSAASDVYKRQVGLVTEYLVIEATSGRRVGRHMTRQVDALRDHFVLCGYGRVGSTGAHELVRDGERFGVIDANPVSLQHARDDGYLVVEG